MLYVDELLNIIYNFLWYMIIHLPACMRKLQKIWLKTILIKYHLNILLLKKQKTKKYCQTALNRFIIVYEK